MAITLVGTKITITADAEKGNSWDDAFTIEDIYNAALAGGWDITKTGINIYNINGYSITANGYLKLKDAFINLIGTNADSYILYGPYRIQFGEYDEATEKVSQGCVVNFSCSGNPRRIRIFNLYDTVLTGPYTYSWAGATVYGKVRNSKTSNIGSENFMYGPMDIKNLHITRCNYGMRCTAEGSTFENIVINNCNIGVWLYQISGITLKRVDARGNTYGFYNQTSASNRDQENTLLGCMYDNYRNTVNRTGTETKDTYCILNIAEYFNLKVIDEEGDPIEGASVTLHNKSDQLVFEAETNSEGEIEEQIVTRIRDEVWKLEINDYYPVQTVYNFNPFKLTIEKEGKQGYETKITIDESRKLDIALLDIPSTVYIDRRVQGQVAAKQITGTTSAKRLTGVVHVTKKEIEGEVHT